MASKFPPELEKLLCDNLPRGSEFSFHYLTSTSATCEPIFPPPPWGSPEPTTGESRLLSASIRHDGVLVHVFAVEAIIYTTEVRTIIFISKADSTGYLHLANLPKSSRSAIRQISCAFLQFLIATQWGRRRLVLALFARAQPQYLFPGSAENSDKHVLDDRRLIRWWCRIVDDVLGRIESLDVGGAGGPSRLAVAAEDAAFRGYVVVPGLDAHETRSYVPRGSKRWMMGSPLRLASSPDLPERCLIPRFPDDPKGRFALDLDGELPENAIQVDESAEAPVPSKTGKWRSVRTIEQFWELMAFRQECAAGRVVGFLWAVFAPLETKELKIHAEEEFQISDTKTNAGSTVPEATQVNGTSQDESEDTQLPKTTDAAASADRSLPAPVNSISPTALGVDSTMYKEITSSLEQLDYADLTIAKTSTGRFLNLAAQKVGLGEATWGISLRGSSEDMPATGTATAVKSGGSEEVNAAPTMLVGRKRKKEKKEEPEVKVAESSGDGSVAGEKNLLEVGQPDKKRLREDEHDT